MDQNSTYVALRRDAARVDRSALARIVLGGADRRALLHGLLTNDIASLAPGTGCYAAWLTPQGRMIADVIVLELDDRMLLLVPAARRDAVLAQIDASIFSEDVTIQDEAGLFEHLGVDGPRAADRVAGVLGAPALPLYGSAQAAFRGAPAIVARTDWLGVPGYDLFVESAAARALEQALAETGAPVADRAAAEAVRVESGRPLFGTDMDEHTIPLEAGLDDRAISFTKGCYVGQEIIIRVLHRGGGRVARKLVGLTLDGEAAPGTPILVGGREGGRLTSVVKSPVLERWIALGYVPREAAAPGTAVEVGQPDAVRPVRVAIVTPLPFVNPQPTS